MQGTGRQTSTRAAAAAAANGAELVRPPVSCPPFHRSDLSDEQGGGQLTGSIPSTWLMMTKLRTV